MSKEDTDKKDKMVPIDFHIGEEIITRYTTNMMVHKMESAFKLSFFEMKPECNVGPDKKNPESVRADCVSSVIVSGDKMPDFIKTMTNFYKEHMFK